MGIISRTDIRQLPLEAFVNTDLVKEIGILEDVGREILPLFLTATEQCSLASSSSSWEKLFHKRFTHIVEDWKKYPFLKSQMKMLHTNQPLQVIKSLFIETDALEKAQPLAEKFGVAQELEEITLEKFPDFIEDLNLVAFCEELNLNDKPLKALDESLSCHAKQLRSWIKNSAALAQVTTLNLNGQELTVLPEEIGLFTGLRDLVLSNNKLSSLPDSIGNLTTLRRLNVCNNELTILPNSIENLSNLKSLALNVNKLSTLPKSIEGLIALKTMSLCHNRIRSLPRSIGNLNHLETLDLTFNQLSTLPNTIENLTSLKDLDLLNNHLHFFPNFILKLPNLLEVNLTTNGMGIYLNARNRLAELHQHMLDFNSERDAAKRKRFNTQLETIAEH